MVIEVVGHLLDPNNNQKFVLRSSFLSGEICFLLTIDIQQSKYKSHGTSNARHSGCSDHLVFIVPLSMMNVPGWFITSLLYSFIPRMKRGIDPKASKILKIIRPRYNPQDFLFFLDMFI